MVVLEIDRQKYGGPSYVPEDVEGDDREELVLKLAREVAETVLIHYGYGIKEIELNAVLTEGEANDEEGK